MLTTVALQILSNLANEVGDLTKGTDNEHRLGPIRSAQSGALSMREMVQAMIVFGVIAIITGSLLIYEAFRDLLNWKSIALFIAGTITTHSTAKAGISLGFHKNTSTTMAQAIPTQLARE